MTKMFINIVILCPNCKLPSLAWPAKWSLDLFSWSMEIFVVDKSPISQQPYCCCELVT